MLSTATGGNGHYQAFGTIYLKKSVYDSGDYQASTNEWGRTTGNSYAYKITTSMNSNGLMTLGRDFDVDLNVSDDNPVLAYVATEVVNESDGSKAVRMSPIEATGSSTHTAGTYIPSRVGTETRDSKTYETFTGIVLYGENAKGSTFTYYIGEDEDATTSQTNYMIASTDNTYVTPSTTKDGVAYTNLGLKSGKFKYYSAAGTLKYNKSYLSMPTSVVGTYNAAKTFNIIFDDVDDNTTGINSVTESNQEKEVWYNLQGARLSGKPSVPGLYIRNGKKVVLNE
jgi:hypothetical protein